MRFCWKLFTYPFLKAQVGQGVEKSRIEYKEGWNPANIIHTILNELKKNGSPEPIFDTDDERNYLETTIRIREGFEKHDKMSDKMSDKQKSFYSALINAFEMSDYVTTKIMAESNNMSGATARRYLNQFCKLTN